MLARTPVTLVYLSADELGITEWDRRILIEVRDDLASGKIPSSAPDWDGNDLSEPLAFNMMHVCGSVRCICGWMNSRGSKVDILHHSLHDLFCPPGNSELWEFLTASQAIHSTDLFLSGAGPDCWPMALADVPA